MWKLYVFKCDPLKKKEIKRFSNAAEKGVPFLKNMLRTFNWEGQFEDVELMQKPYQNLTKHNGTDAVMYLAKRYPDDPDVRRYARELQRFSEDQFVVWEQPGWMYKYHIPGFRPLSATKTKVWGNYNWFTPTVLEQYRCFMPVDASLAKMIRYYLFMYDLEKNPLDLAKARALGDALTRVQTPDGRIPTWCDPNRAVETDWINCGFATASVMGPSMWAKPASSRDLASAALCRRLISCNASSDTAFGSAPSPAHWYWISPWALTV
jgi:hypothetical protein